MSQQTAIELIRGVLEAALWISLPLLSVMFIVGILVSIVQILTSIQDPSFSAIPRLAAFFATMLVLLPWILMRTIDYTERLFGNLMRYAH
jgi:flagellar biosynthesis protein FliQ